MIEKNYAFFKKEEKKLKKDYPDEYILICNEKVVFHDKDFEKVVEYAKSLEAGTYIIQQCSSIEAKYIQTYHTRVAFK